MTNSSLVGGKVGKKLEQLKNIQNVGSLLFSVNHDLILSYIFFYSGSILDIFYPIQSNICSVPLEWTCSEVEKLAGEVSFLRAKFSFPRSNGPFSRLDSCQNRAKRDFGSPDREKGPFDRGNENFARRKE